MKFKFSGIIDCNTEIELDNIRYSEIKAIDRFIRAIDDSTCSYVRASISTTVTGKECGVMLDVGDRVWFIKRPEEIHHVSSKCGLASPKSLYF
jgi:hypothetical protein